MIYEILMIGIGGEGVLTIGDILMNAGNEKGYGVSLYTFYGSQMRGGESGCVVKIDTDGNNIVNPTITSPDYYLVVNEKHLDKYLKFKNEKSKCIYLKENNIPNDKTKNIKVLKTFIKELKNNNQIFNDEDIINAMKIRFKKENVFLSNKKVYEDYD